MSINRRSDLLTVLVGSYNRLPDLRRCLDSIAEGTTISHETIVLDGGSTDGSIEHLRARSDVTPILQGRLVGAVRAYNAVWREVDSRYTCWLSDDTEIVAGALDSAVQILDAHADIGMVGLKMRDTAGPQRNEPYMGALSRYGILNCNHGVLRTDLLRSIGYLDERYYSYGFDPDLTASVIASGFRVVHTKAVAVLHRRGDRELLDRERASGADSDRIYREKWAFLADGRTTLRLRIGWRLTALLRRTVYRSAPPDARRLGLTLRDCRNIAMARFMSPLDPFHSRGKTFHLAQRAPRAVLARRGNPFR